MGITATYLFPTHPEQEKIAEQHALGLTIGSWTDIQHLEQQQLKHHKGELYRWKKGKSRTR